MDHHLCVLLYSKYSPMSNKMLEALESCPVNLENVIGLRPVCIDNKEVREQILKANKIEVSSVPCVLIVYRNGGVEKYEGGSCLQWIDNTVNKYKPSDDIQPVNVKKKKQKIIKFEESGEDESEEYESEEEKPISKIKRTKKNNRSFKNSSFVDKTKKIANISSTNMDDLDMSDSEEYQKNIVVDRPPVGVRSGPGEYELTNEFGKEEQNRDFSRNVKKSVQTASSKTDNDLMATAMAMQKERENVDSKKNRGPIEVNTNKRPL